LGRSELRFGYLKDHPDLVDQYVSLRNQYADLLLTGAVELAGTREWLQRATVVVLCAMSGATLEGTVVLYTDKGGEIAFFVRTPGRGLGSSLVSLIVDEAGKRGLERVWAWVLKDNPGAGRAFLKNGFTMTGESDRYHDGVHKCGNEFSYSLSKD
jgi:GNAT superfamily N-acetyltransferase